MPTKIILDKQSDLILTSPSITNPTGIVASNLTDTTLEQNVQVTLDATRSNLSVETSRAVSAEDSI